MFRLGFVVAALSCAGVGGGEAKKVAEALDLRTRGGEVLIAAGEIVAYDWPSHTLTLKPGLRKQLLTKLRTSLAAGHPFVVTVGGKRVYEGRMTSLLSSASFPTPVIVLDAAVYDRKLGEDRVRIDLGYPGRNVYEGEDPRGDPRIEAALKAGGKLRPVGDK